MKNLILCMVLSAALIGCAEKKETPANTTTAKQTAADVGAGKIIAERDCKACHGVDGGRGAGYSATWRRSASAICSLR